ncbi:hypothetical protein HMPREF0864_03699 [Enterobacteriaceae bacterium 9_2_54FAA]|nr:hypothetical protein HMPREF0864_03699 [Enterobacteriaceae bacterium 9_2_54FAA]
MSAFIQSILSEYSSIYANSSAVFVANGRAEPPGMAYRLPLPRLELTVKGVMTMLVPKGTDKIMRFEQPVGTITYIPANGWNLPDWSTPVISLSLVLSRQDIGFSMINWDGHQFKEVEKFALQHASVNIRDHILQLTEELAWSQDTTSETFSHLVLALANNIYDQLSQTTSNHINVSLIDDIKCYIDNNFDQSVSRDSVAAFFNISPSYLSRLFTRSSEVKFNEYLTQTRIAKSRLLLINTTLKIREISAKSGFIDNNYFCKVFKLINECTPMEYRKINRNHSLTNKS